MDTTGGEKGKCACGTYGPQWDAEDNNPWQSRVHTRMTISKDNTGMTPHKSTWTWHDGTGTEGGMRGVCHTTGQTSHDENGNPWPKEVGEGHTELIESQRERYGANWPPQR